MNIRWISTGSLVLVSASISRIRALMGCRSSPPTKARRPRGV